MGTDLDTSGGHAELVGEELAEGGVGLGVCSEMVLEDLELGAGGALAVLDLVGLVGIECAEVDGGDGTVVSGRGSGAGVVGEHGVVEEEEGAREVGVN